MIRNVSLRRIGDAETSFVIRNFEEFCSEIIHQKQAVMDSSSVCGEKIANSAPTDATQNGVAKSIAINNKLIQILESQALEASERGGEFATSYYREAQYIMAALADEIFLNFDWEGRRYWEDNLIESRLFDTHDAGDMFFQRLDQFLATRDPMRRDLAELYLLALGLGFEGKYRGNPKRDILDLYRNNLYTFIHHHEARFYSEEERIFPEAYAYTLDQSEPGMMQDQRLWYSAFIVIFVVVFGFSHLMWRNAIGDMEATVQNIQNESIK